MNRNRKKEGEGKGKTNEKKGRGVEEVELEKCRGEKPSEGRTGNGWWLRRRKEKRSRNTKEHASKRINELIISCGDAMQHCAMLCLKGTNVTSNNTPDVDNTRATNDKPRFDDIPVNR